MGIELLFILELEGLMSCATHYISCILQVFCIDKKFVQVYIYIIHVYVHIYIYVYTCETIHDACMYHICTVYCT